ncbi:MAG: FKBP-type peptidyl-prolyl cis-trans isomerase [Pseudomonadota bacterium]|nr:FKBP-type peptidyl-prolyl cis-trans isomerase [Pseudomonadota bacterium]
MTAIQSGSRVTLTFALHLESGELVDETTQPASFEVGDGKLLPHFEQLLEGLEAGAKRSFVIEEAFGVHNPKNLQFFSLNSFEEAPEPGLVMNFSSPSGDLPGVINSVTNEQVEVDFNHPLAGKTILFSVEILDVDNSRQTSNGINIRNEI